MTTATGYALSRWGIPGPRSYATRGEIVKGKQGCSTYEMSSVEKFTTVEIKLSLMITPLMALQSAACSPSNKQMDSKASFTAGGGFPMERTSTRCCFLMDFTAKIKRNGNYTRVGMWTEEVTQAPLRDKSTL